MSNVIIIILLLVLIFKDIKFKKPEKVVEKQDEKEVQKQKEIREEFDKLMGYSIRDAIESKKVN